jgi:hypothetical protein
VYKKGDKLDCKNYRGICLLNVGRQLSSAASKYRTTVRTPLKSSRGLIKETQLLTCADDIYIVSRSLEAGRDACLVQKAGTAKVGLKINEQKTKYMIAAENRSIFDARQTVAFGDKNFEIKKS